MTGEITSKSSTSYKNLGLIETSQYEEAQKIFKLTLLSS